MRSRLWCCLIQSQLDSLRKRLRSRPRARAASLTSPKDAITYGIERTSTATASPNRSGLAPKRARGRVAVTNASMSTGIGVVISTIRPA